MAHGFRPSAAALAKRKRTDAGLLGRALGGLAYRTECPELSRKPRPDK